MARPILPAARSAPAAAVVLGEFGAELYARVEEGRAGHAIVIFSVGIIAIGAAQPELAEEAVAKFDLAAHVGTILPQLDRRFLAQVRARRDAIFAVEIAEGNAKLPAVVHAGTADRSEERRVGKEGENTCR